MSNVSYRNEQWNCRYDSHIAPVNYFVDTLRGYGYGEIPYVAPIYGGVNAKLLTILRDPGPMTQVGIGSGFISMENDDATAETICNYYSDAGINAEDVMPWNAYPWYINRTPKTFELERAVEPFIELLSMLPKLKVIMLHGCTAKNFWKKLVKQHQGLLFNKDLHVIETYHTSKQAFWHKDREVRAQRRENLKKAFADASRILRDN